MKKAVILVSGGLDSATCLAIARDQGFTCNAISFDYMQRHRIELEAAKRVATANKVEQHQIINISIGELGGSALTDTQIDVPDYRHPEENAIPVTYVPARNTVFLSIALGWAEVLQAYDIFIGVNAIDYSNYPDCRPDYIAAFEKMANLATKAGVEGQQFKIHAPLLNLSKAEIIKLGTQLGVDYSLTLSCYQPDKAGRACGRCDSCTFRKQGFAKARIPDPTVYIS